MSTSFQTAPPPKPSTGNSNPHIAFFGPTGGCTLAALIHCLKNGYTGVALSRSSDKLVKLLDERGITADFYSGTGAHLRIVQGDAKDPEAVKRVFEERPVDVIVSGVGNTIDLSLGFQSFTTFDKTLCQSVVRTIFTTLSRTLLPPLFICISTTGIDPTKRDVPLPYLPFYKAFLSTPHKDKILMEKEVIKAKEQGLISDFVIVRPAFLDDGKGVRRAKKGKVPKLYVGEDVVGYTVTRQVVGDLVFECVRDGREGRYCGKKPAVALDYP